MKKGSFFRLKSISYTQRSTLWLINSKSCQIKAILIALRQTFVIEKQVVVLSKWPCPPTFLYKQLIAPRKLY